MNNILELRNIHASVEDKAILKGLDLDIKPGEVHAIMGPNGSGKSTLSNVITGNDIYTLDQGSIKLVGEEISEDSVEDRACKGIFLAFQYPTAIPGISNMSFMKSALNAKRDFLGLEPLDEMDFKALVRQTRKIIDMPDSLLDRDVNYGFSGGEKKKNEIFQMALLDPKLCILDETDSGLDIDALRIVADGVNSLRDGNRSFLVITHYQRLLDYIVPDVIHVMVDGKIVESGGKELALILEEKGYAHWRNNG